jgi:1-deoxy-D-xylulose-5-phosphate synthase
MADSPAVPPGRLLATITGPHDLRGLSAEQLTVLAAEIREFLIDRVSRTGGHLGPNLGVVELTIALHRVFDSPTDRLLFDTGHQTYVHKLLTGRQQAFTGLRQADGLSGYPSRMESGHDTIENSHASTALSYADGLAAGFALRGLRHRRVVAVVGDGALTGGMCWEALNNIGATSGRAVVIVLNDNGRSYSPTAGALAGHLAELRDSSGGPQPNLFETLGLAYLGPVDGHDIVAVERAVERAAGLGRSVVVHCVTRKGKGYRPAETDVADCLHAVGTIERTTGKPHRTPAQTWTSVFADEIAKIGAEYPEIVAITAAMLRPAGLHDFALAFPDRVLDVGIAEQHAVTSAAGLALAGMHPVVAVYATFLGRAFDQLLMDVALHDLPVTFVLDRAGITGPDGPSHHGMWDLSLLAAVPHLRIAVPRDPARLRELLRATTATRTGPTALRFPKAPAGPDIASLGHRDGLDILRHAPGADVLLIGLGPLASTCTEAAAILTARGIGVTVVDPRWAAPINPLLCRLAGTHRLTVTVEDNVETGGFGARLAHLLTHTGSTARLRTIALPHRFLPHGPRAELLRQAGLDTTAIVRTIAHHLDDDRQRVTTADTRSTQPRFSDGSHGACDGTTSEEAWAVYENTRRR